MQSKSDLLNNPLNKPSQSQQDKEKLVNPAITTTKEAQQPSVSKVPNNPDGETDPKAQPKQASAIVTDSSGELLPTDTNPAVISPPFQGVGGHAEPMSPPAAPTIEATAVTDANFRDPKDASSGADQAPNSAMPVFVGEAGALTPSQPLSINVNAPPPLAEPTTTEPISYKQQQVIDELLATKAPYELRFRIDRDTTAVVSKASLTSEDPALTNSQDETIGDSSLDIVANGKTYLKALPSVSGREVGKWFVSKGGLVVSPAEFSEVWQDLVEQTEPYYVKGDVANG